MHDRYRRARPDGLDLVLMGGGDAALPAHPWLHRTGFVDEQVKHDALAGAAVVVVPSAYESLSFAQLEAWSHGRADARQRRARRCSSASRAAPAAGSGTPTPTSTRPCSTCSPGARRWPQALGRQGRRYVERECSWERVREAWLVAIRDVAEGPPATARLHSSP